MLSRQFNMQAAPKHRINIEIFKIRIQEEVPNSIILPWSLAGGTKETSRIMDLLSLFLTTNVVV